MKGAVGFKKALEVADVTPEDVRKTGGNVRIEVKEHPTVVLYDKLGLPRFVPANAGNVERCLRADGTRLYSECPICKEEHEPPNFDVCPKLPEGLTMTCQVCGKIFRDGREFAIDRIRERRPGEIEPTAPGTEEMRVRMSWEEHMGVYHPGYARAMGLDIVAIRKKFDG